MKAAFISRERQLATAAGFVGVLTAREG